MVWGTGGGKIDKDRLDPLGLSCWGGGSGKPFWGKKKNNVGMTYNVFNNDRSFDFEVYWEDFQNIDKVYKEWFKNNRKEKLIKIENGLK